MPTWNNVRPITWESGADYNLLICDVDYSTDLPSPPEGAEVMLRVWSTQRAGFQWFTRDIVHFSTWFEQSGPPITKLLNASKVARFIIPVLRTEPEGMNPGCRLWGSTWPEGPQCPYFWLSLSAVAWHSTINLEALIHPRWGTYPLGSTTIPIDYTYSGGIDNKAMILPIAPGG